MECKTEGGILLWQATWFLWVSFYLFDTYYREPRRRKKYKEELVTELHKQLMESPETIVIEKSDKHRLVTPQPPSTSQ